MVFFEKLKKYDIILASKSPRRQQLLNETHINFRVAAGEFDESVKNTNCPEEFVISLCKFKASFYNDLITQNNSLLITADTIVCCDGQILNKPKTENDLFGMLEMLSGNKHYVYTGVCLKSLKKEAVFYEKTAVVFENLMPEEIRYYSYKFKPYDKAGGYGIQEWIGLIGIKRIEGSYHNVVGLPVARLIKEMKGFID